ncbi:MAG: hypothetical protein ACXADS_12605 [Candidatus Thorarchaeota archaeon]
MSRRDRDYGRDKTKILLAVALISVLAVWTFPVWSPYLPNIPWGPGIEQGVKLTGTVNYANHTAVDSETVQFVDPATETATYTAAIDGGSFVTNRGPIDGGTFEQYISLGDCMLFVQTVVVPSAEDYEHESYTVDDAVVFTNAATTGWSSLITGGAVANAFTGGGSAQTANYTASAGNALSFDMKVTLATDYAKLFREYTDPYDGIGIEPVLWISSSSAVGVYSTDSSDNYKTWTAGNYTYFIMPLSQLTAPSTIDVDGFWGIDLVFSSAGWYEFTVDIVDGSSMAYLETSKSQTANPNSGETVTVHSMVDAFVIAS